MRQIIGYVLLVSPILIFVPLSTRYMMKHFGNAWTVKFYAWFLGISGTAGLFFYVITG